MKACPRCSLLNPDEGMVCECGFDLVNGDVAAATAVRRAVRRRGRACQIGGIGLVIFGLAEGTAYLPFEMSLFFSIQSYRADLGMIIAGAILLARGARLIDRPWTPAKRDDRPTG
jgi:hypothetical protein